MSGLVLSDDNGIDAYVRAVADITVHALIKEGIPVETVIVALVGTIKGVIESSVSVSDRDKVHAMIDTCLEK